MANDHLIPGLRPQPEARYVILDEAAELKSPANAELLQKIFAPVK